MSFKTIEVGIAVDFGMTSSAVTWKTADDPEHIHIITQWPSHSIDVSKVPTKVKLDPSGSISWGFQCQSDNGASTKELFKLLLEPAVFHSPDRTWFCQIPPQDIDEVGCWILAYLRCLIGHSITIIGDHQQKRFGTPASPVRLHLHCILTTPTTWDASTIRTFGCIARGAIDIACQIPEVRAYAPTLKRLQYNITEPEAVASYVLHSNICTFAEGDTFLLLDVGGGTSDPCFFRVAKSSGQWVCLPLGAIRGLSRGANDIHREFQLHVRYRLHIAGFSNVSNLAYRMIPCVPQQHHSGAANQDPIGVIVPGCSRDFNHKEAGICNGEMIIDDLDAIVGAFDYMLKAFVSGLLEVFADPPKGLVLAGGGSYRPSIATHLEHIAPISRCRRLEAVAFGCLVKWNQQLLLMTVILRDTPIKKFLVGKSQRGAGQEVMTHIWRKRASGGLVTASYLIEFPLVQGQGWQKWEITIKAAQLPPLLCNFSEGDQNRTVEVRVDLRLPRVSPYVSGEDFEAFTVNGLNVPCTAMMTPVAYGDIFPTSP